MLQEYLTHDLNGFHLTGADGKLDYSQSPIFSHTLYSDYYWYEIGDVIGYTTNERLNHFIHDIVSTSFGKNEIRMSEPVAEAMKNLRRFMFERVYQNPEAKSEEGKAEVLMETLYLYYMKHVDELPDEFLNLLSEGEPRERVVCDYVGAMSDRFAIAKYEEIYIPKSWHV